MSDKFLHWARKLQSIAATGLHYCREPYDRQRYGEVRDVAAGMLALAADVDEEAARGCCRAEFGPGTPKVVVRGAVFDGERILMVRESADGRWALPGGWAEVDEPPSLACQREVREETGLEVRAERLICLYDMDARLAGRRPFHAYTALFLCRLLGGVPATSLETTEVAFFARQELPELSPSRISRAEIDLAFAARDNPSAPAAFD